MIRAPLSKVVEFKQFRKGLWRLQYEKKRELGICVGATCLNEPDVDSVRCGQCRRRIKRKRTIEL